MKTKVLKLSALFLLSIFAFNSNAITIDSDGHTILDFNDLSPGQVTSYGQINFSNFVFTDGNTAQANSFVPGSLFTLTPDGTSSFDLFDADFIGFGGPVNVIATFLDGTVDSSHEITLTSVLTNHEFNLFGLQSVEFITTTGGVIGIDNIDVPEPSTLALLGLGLLGFGLSQLKRKS